MPKKASSNKKSSKTTKTTKVVSKSNRQKILKNKVFWIGLGSGLLTAALIVTPIIATEVISNNRNNNITVSAAYQFSTSASVKPCVVAFSGNNNELSTYEISNNDLPKLENIIIDNNNQNDVMINLKFTTLTIKPTFSGTAQSVTIPAETIRFTLGAQHIKNSDSFASVVFTIKNSGLTINNGQSIEFKDLELSAKLVLDQYGEINPSGQASTIKSVQVK